MRRFILIVLMTMSAATARAQEVQAVLVGGETEYTVSAGDTLREIAARFAVTTERLVELNHLTRPDRLSVGRVLAIRNPHIAIVDPNAAITINVAQRMLFYSDGGRISGYPITVGSRGWPTPLGAFTITEKEVDPAWDVPVSIQREMEAEGQPVITRMEPSPDNPLGSRWMRLSLPGLGIHGTNAPSSIYRYASHGCIRMHPAHVVELFDRVAVGAAGVLLYRPVLIAVIGDAVWLEAHPDPYRRDRNAERQLRDIAERHGLTASIDWASAARILQRREGIAVDVTQRD